MLLDLGQCDTKLQCSVKIKVAFRAGVVGLFGDDHDVENGSDEEISYLISIADIS